MKPLLDTEKLQGGVFKLKLVPENMKFEELEITKTSVLSEDESDHLTLICIPDSGVSSMNFSGVSVEEPTPTTSMSNRKPLSQVKLVLFKGDPDPNFISDPITSTEKSKTKTSIESNR